MLPLFGGIYRRGAGLGPAIAFLYSGPAINVLAIVLTAKVLGVELGVARAVGAVAFALVIGGIMHWIYRREEAARALTQKGFVTGAGQGRPLGETAAFFALQIAVLVFANWAPASAEDSAVWHGIFAWKWPLTALAGAGLAGLLIARWHWRWPPLAATAALVALLAGLFPQHPELAFGGGLLGLTLAATAQPGDGEEWLGQSWGFAKLILPLLLGGVLLAGFLLGRPGHEGIIPSEWVSAAVGGNSLAANFLAALVGAFMYFATLTEVPIVQGLIGAGMGKGPALALLLAGPALSLPSMLVIRSILGTQKTWSIARWWWSWRPSPAWCSVRFIHEVDTMIKIQIYGTGCPKCILLAQHAEAAAQALGLEYEVEKITDINAIIDAGVMSTPGLGVNGEVKSAGRVLSAEAIQALLG